MRADVSGSLTQVGVCFFTINPVIRQTFIDNVLDKDHYQNYQDSAEAIWTNLNALFHFKLIIFNYNQEPKM